jgi:hypothetical protein
MNSPSLLIQFDPNTWTPAAIFPNGQTDQETARLQVIADKMLKNIESPERSENED